MPLRVHCPSGCYIRLPANRAGKIVRCPECKKAIRVGTVSQTELESNKPIPTKAVFVKVAEAPQKPEIARFPSIDKTSADLPEIPDIPPLVETSRKRPKISRKLLSVPPIRKAQADSQGNKQLKLSSRELESERPQQPPSVSLDAPTAPAVVTRPKVDFHERVNSSRQDRITLLKLFGVGLCAVALINLGPAIYYWYEWSQSLERNALPRWIYLQVMIAAMHLIYAVFLFQIPDWSALKAVAVAMLVFAFIFGMVSTGLVTGGGHGNIARFLEIPFVMTKQASIWCVAMLLLSILMCYLGGKESLNWQRAEQLLRDILIRGGQD